MKIWCSSHVEYRNYFFKNSQEFIFISQHLLISFNVLKIDCWLHSFWRSQKDLKRMKSISFDQDSAYCCLNHKLLLTQANHTFLAKLANELHSFISQLLLLVSDYLSLRFIKKVLEVEASLLVLLFNFIVFKEASHRSLTSRLILCFRMKLKFC